MTSALPSCNVHVMSTGAPLAGVTDRDERGNVRQVGHRGVGCPVFWNTAVQGTESPIVYGSPAGAGVQTFVADAPVSSVCACAALAKATSSPAISTSTSARDIVRGRDRNAAVNVSPPCVREGHRPAPTGIRHSRFAHECGPNGVHSTRSSRPKRVQSPFASICRLPAPRLVTALQPWEVSLSTILRIHAAHCEGSSPK